jgi:murein DD-endopeptidase MepM/ murein hydrolase activator NlpD
MIGAALLAGCDSVQNYLGRDPDEPVVPTALTPPGQAKASYIVNRGDTVYSVSQRYNVPVRALIEANRLEAPYVLLVGQRVEIPSGRIHTVAKGETLNGVARRYGVDVATLVRTNQLQAPYLLKIGQTLNIPAGVAASNGQVAAASQPLVSSAPPQPVPATGKVEVTPLAAPVPVKSATGGTAPAPLTGTSPTASPSAPPAAAASPVQTAAVPSASSGGAAPASPALTPAPAAGPAVPAPQSPSQTPPQTSVAPVPQGGQQGTVSAAPQTQPVPPAKPAAPVQPVPSPQTVAAVPPSPSVPAADPAKTGAGIAEPPKPAPAPVPLKPEPAKQADPPSAAPVPLTEPATPVPINEPAPPPAKPAAAAALPVPPARGGRSFQWPVVGRVIASYGETGQGLRNDGINILANKGSPIRAAENGVVVYAGDEIKGFGNLLLIRHADGFTTAYAHADSLLVNRGDTVRRGQVIARVGQTGNVTQPQLHFEIRKGTQAVDPQEYLGRPTALLPHDGDALFGG